MIKEALLRHNILYLIWGQLLFTPNQCLFNLSITEITTIFETLILEVKHQVWFTWWGP